MAVAFDASSHGNNKSLSSLTVSHTCTGTNLILIVALAWGTGTGVTISGITYNSVSMTQIGSTIVEATLDTSLFYLINPTTGANNIVATLSGATRVSTLVGMSFTGVRQTNPIGAIASNGNTTTVSSISDSITTLNDKSIVVDTVSGAATSATPGTFTATGTGETQAAQDGASDASNNAYYNAADYTSVISPAASQTMSSNISIASARWAHILAEIIDATIPLSVSKGGTLSLLGVG